MPLALARSQATAVDRGLDKATGFIGHSNNISAGVTSGLIYDENGHIIGPSDNGILPTELPIATDSSLGAVIVPADTGLTVDSAGQLDHTDSVAPGLSAALPLTTPATSQLRHRLAPSICRLLRRLKLARPRFLRLTSSLMSMELSPMPPAA